MPVETLLLIRGLLLFLVLSPVRRGAARGTDRPVVSVPGSVDAQARSHFHAALTGCGLFLCFKQRAFPGWHAVSFTQPGVFRLRVGGGEGVEGWYVVFVLVVLCLVLIAFTLLTELGGRGGVGKPAPRSFLPPANPQIAGLGTPAARADPGS